MFRLLLWVDLLSIACKNRTIWSHFFQHKRPWVQIWSKRLFPDHLLPANYTEKTSIYNGAKRLRTNTYWGYLKKNAYVIDRWLLLCANKKVLTKIDKTLRSSKTGFKNENICWGRCRGSPPSWSLQARQRLWPHHNSSSNWCRTPSIIVKSQPTKMKKWQKMLKILFGFFSGRVRSQNVWRRFLRNLEGAKNSKLKVIQWLKQLIRIWHCMNILSGLVVMGWDSQSEGRGLESQHHLLDEHFFTLIYAC